MRTKVRAPVALVALLALSAAPCSASQGRWGLALGGGKTPPVIDGYGGRGLATMSAFCSLSKHVSVQTRAAYVWSQRSDRSSFLPVGLGVRLFADAHPSRQSGLFIEAAPSLYVSRWSDSHGSLTAALPGYQIGGGFQVPAFDNAGIELGALYLKSKDFGSSKYSNTFDRSVYISRFHSGLDEIAFHASVVTGF